MKLFYASDVHGSETCWRKFLNAGPFYKAETIIMGGDVTGKGIVPIVEDEGRWRARYRGAEYDTSDPAELAKLEHRITFNGMYPYRLSQAELDRLTSAPNQDELFDELMETTFARWLDIADSKLDVSGVQCWVMPGNDDAWSIDGAFENSRHVQNCDQRVVELPGGHEMLSVGLSNRTPWDSPREVDDERLGEMIDELAGQVRSMETAIFNLHVPPYDSTLDLAPRLDAELNIQMSGGNPEMIPVGSAAVRTAIEKYQPLLALHGHIHESKGARKIGRTLCINPGSSYGLGQLDGVIVELRDSSVRRHQFIVG
jgi:Icc-related predicted phosphoesterase